jgi:glyoxylase-like metal-dependent hydrolase (beta-lactamase superfamily II)
MPVKLIKIIKNGNITVEAFEEPEPKTIALKNLCGIGGGSTVTYIESDAKIIVDTGFDFESNFSRENVERNRKVLIQHLRNFDLKPEDIDIVFITHWHLDHFGNLGIFGESEVMVAKEAVEKYNLDFTGVKDGEKIADGVRVMHTPGHTSHHSSLLLETEKLRYSEMDKSGGRITGIGSVKVVVAGDAVVTPAYYLMGRIWSYNADFSSEEKAVESMRKIEKIADFIVPGHGGMFRVSKK